MKKIFFYISIAILPQVAIATPAPVTHSHDGRTHRHVLPNNGMGRHSHNRGNQHKKNRKTTVALGNHWIRDQRNCIHYNPKPIPNESLRWTGKCRNGYGSGSGTITWYKNGKKDNSYSAILVKGRKKKSEGLSDAEKAGLVAGGALVLWGLSKMFGGGSSSSSSSSSSYSAPSYSFCGSNDRCHQLIKFKKSGSAIIKCTKGMYTGQEKCLSYKKSTGKYATGCGMSDTFAHHYTLEKAAHSACD